MLAKAVHVSRARLILRVARPEDDARAVHAALTRRGGRLAAALVLALAVLGVVASGAAAHKTRTRGLALNGDPLVVDVSGLAPEVETEGATEVKRSSALLRARVNPEGSTVTACEFEYGTTPSLGTKIACAYSPGSGEDGIPVYAIAEGLAEHTTYYYRIFAKNQFGEGHGRKQEFTTPPGAPRVVTEPATEIARTSATLNGIVNPRGSEVTECLFEYGTSERYGHTLDCSSLPGSGEKDVEVSAKLTTTEDTNYFYRLVARNSLGARYGERERFTTPPSAPEARTESSSAVGRSTATLEGSVNPRGGPIKECLFLYGTSKSYGKEVSCSSIPPAGESFVEVSASLSGLAEHQAYDFELVVTNEKGEEGSGGNQSFNTFPTAPRDSTMFANELTSDSAQLHGQVNPDGETTTCTFEYGETERRFPNSVPCLTSPGKGETPVSVSGNVTGLKANTTYYFRLRAENVFGEAYGGQSKFTTTESGLAPEVKKLSPSKGSPAGGTAVKIKGANFSGATEVKFGTNEAEKFTVTSVKTITAIAPPHTTGAIFVTVTTPSGTSATGVGSEFTYQKPSISGLSPNSGTKAGGTKVTVTGAGFSTEAGETTFEFGVGKASSVSCSSSEVCTLLTPASSKEGEVKVTVHVGGKDNVTNPGKGFTYTT